MANVKVTLKDGSVKEVAAGTTLLDVAKGLSQKLGKQALLAVVDGVNKDLTDKLEHDAAVEFVVPESTEGLHAIRHTAAHVMAQAIQHLFPGTKFAIGPAIANGFYYDLDSEHVFVPEDLAAIEKEMAKIVKANIPLVRSEIPRKEALEMFAAKDEKYKVELITDLPEDAVISTYTQGDFTDLCAGPHCPSTGRVKAFKLQSIAGAYWRGDEKNKMLQRIYGVCFPTAEELEAHLQLLEEAKERDHRKIGKEMNLFMSDDLVGRGLPMFLPKGYTVWQELENYIKAKERKLGYLHVMTPCVGTVNLYKTSGHWDHYKENMYTTVIDDTEFAIKPMNCPGGILVYKSKPRSYRDLPIRMGELGLVHRHEKSGALHGLMRVRCFTQDDAHIFMTPDQITDEIKGVVRLIDEVYKLFGFKYHVELSTQPEDSMGSQEDWDMATEGLRKALDSLGLPYVVNEGDGAFYGPKIDFHLEDSLGRTWQCGTIQLDFQLPMRFELEYTGADGEKHRPIMIHRVVFGSIERFIGILTEHFAGAFPIWLAPVQVELMPIADRHNEFTSKVAAELKKRGIRVEVDGRSEKIGFKIREAQLQKIPYMLVIGDKEVETENVSIRCRKRGDIGTMSVSDFCDMVEKEIREKTIITD